jgi:hypothetical protein
MNRARRSLVVAGLVAAASATLLWGGLAMAAIGLTTVPSDFGPKETMDRLEAEIKSVGMTVFARIDHAAGAASVGLPLRSTELRNVDNQGVHVAVCASNDFHQDRHSVRTFAYKRFRRHFC